MRVFGLTLLFVFIALSSNAEEKPKSRLSDKYIAVFELDTDGVDKSISRPLTESIRRELVKAGIYKVMDRSNMNKIMDEQKFQYSCAAGECIVEAGKLLGVGKIVNGSVSIVGKTYYLSLQLVNVETGNIEDVSEDKCKCEVDDLIESSKRLARRLMGEKVPEQAAKPAPEVAYEKSSFQPNEVDPLAFLKGSWACSKDGTFWYTIYLSVNGKEVKYTASNYSAVFTAEITGGDLVLSGRSTSNPEYGQIIDKYKVSDNRTMHYHSSYFRGNSTAPNLYCRK